MTYTMIHDKPCLPNLCETKTDTNYNRYKLKHSSYRPNLDLISLLFVVRQNVNTSNFIK